MSLELDHATMQRLGRQVADHVARHLAGLREQRVVKTLSRREAEPLIYTPPPREGADFDALMAFLETRVFPHHTPEPHPGFLAYVQSCATFPAVMGDWLAAGYNFFGGAWAVASGPAMLEVTVLEWFRQWIGMPEGTGGLLTSGGSTANLMALVAARHAVVGDDASRIPRLSVYTSNQMHSSVVRAAWIAGIPRANLRILPVDDSFRMRLPALEQAIHADRAAGFLPVAVVGSAGTTNTGATDPLPEIASLCREHGIWFHVDAAYGGFAALCPRGKAELEGIGLADSVTLDPHKWLYVPFECGSLLAREPRRLLDAFHILPDYLRDLGGSGGEVNFADYGEQLSREARAIKVWTGVSYYGTERLAEEIGASIGRAELAERLVRATPGLEVLAPARLAIFCFRAHPARLDEPAALDALNQRVLERVNADGHFFISTTRIRGALALRICACGWRTTDADIERLVGEVRQAAEN
ncbi:MAG: aminotransferase class V-fold PLP-dependent enzyme [Gemmatimonadota bacterium]|nr:aminotransferase class V-fold PLP-dependent enzyme [Gemmatimonadota bacterium]MDH4348438.1 aminotransferase class V-fold PLP-dependent enzyme [Gemmatimonadota bacterium]MDH5282368.1 aminotransferase class V-fold PLP-dependent enzyme [Gemmatimonadota bacterium]